jgi:heat shock protein HslJ
MDITRRAALGSLLGVLSLIAVACGDDGSGEPVTSANSTSSELPGKSYNLVGVTGLEVPDGSALNMTFLATDLTISGGCNTMTGGWSVDANRLVTTELAQTQMACDAALMTFDDQIAQFVGAEPVITVTSDQMTLVKDEITLNFRESVGVDDVALEGTLWTVTGTLEGDATASLDTEPATITFDAGTAAVFAGCNTGSVTYTLADTTIEFGELVLTRMACAEPATKLEATVTSVLTGSRTYDIEGTKLTIATPEGTGLALTSAP